MLVIDQFNSNDREHLELSSRPELGITLMKLRCWLLEQYAKCVFLNADCLVLRPIDDLFEREEFSAAPDGCRPDCFNSGVFVYRPSRNIQQIDVVFITTKYIIRWFVCLFLFCSFSSCYSSLFQVMIKIFSINFFPIGELEICLDIYHSFIMLQRMHLMFLLQF